jgi:hypothetical protein
VNASCTHEEHYGTFTDLFLCSPHQLWKRDVNQYTALTFLVWIMYGIMHWFDLQPLG